MSQVTGGGSVGAVGRVGIVGTVGAVGDVGDVGDVGLVGEVGDVGSVVPLLLAQAPEYEPAISAARATMIAAATQRTNPNLMLGSLTAS